MKMIALFEPTKNVLRLYLFLKALSLISGLLSISFNPEDSPPAIIPRDGDRYYSIPLNQRLSKPIIAHILSNNQRPKDDFLLTVEVKITSMDYLVAQSKSTTDEWAEKGGILCMWAYNVPYPLRYDNRKAKLICGNSTTLPLIRAIDGLIIAEGISHNHNSLVPSNKRVFRFHLETKQKFYADTHPFIISTPAYTLNILKQPPKNILANTPFTVVAEILDKNGNRVTSGLDSTAFVNFLISYEFKTFYSDLDSELYLQDTEVRMESSQATIHATNKDHIIRNRAESGVIVFEDIRILDVHKGVRFNLTLTLPRYPWSRTPHIYSDYLLINLGRKETGDLIVKMNSSCKLDPAVVLTSKVDILEQTARSLVIVSKDLMYSKIGANFPIPVSVEARDSNGRRIYSGRDSNLTVNVSTIPTGACISVDSNFQLKEGVGKFTGSICDMHRGVKLQFQITSQITGITLHSELTNTIEITGDVYIADFLDTFHKGINDHPRSHTNSFIRFAVKDINSGLLPGFLNHRTLRLKSFDTKGDVSTSVKWYKEIVNHGNKNPNEIIRTVIGFDTDPLSDAIGPLITSDEIPQISLEVTNSKFGIKEYPFFNRLCWKGSAIINSVLLAAKERKWIWLILVRSQSYIMDDDFYEIAAFHNIHIGKEVVIPEISGTHNWVDGSLSKEMKYIREHGTKIIFLFVSSPLQYAVLREAYLAGISCMHGYQWVKIGIMDIIFPFMDRHPVCVREPTCSTAFTGLIIFAPIYNIGGYSSPDWRRVLGYYVKVDGALYHSSNANYFSYYDGGELGLAYDAVTLFATALTKIIKNKETATGRKIITELRAASFHGLTGHIELDNEGSRRGYIGILIVVNPMHLSPKKLYSNIPRVTRHVRFFLVKSNISQIEIPYQTFFNDSEYLVGQMALPKSEQFNIRFYASLTGMISRDTQKLIQHINEPWPPESIVREEPIVPTFSCTNRCGNRLMDITDINVYDNGHCVIGNKCKCNHGYEGNSCESIQCKCIHGDCITPSSCMCFYGFSGNDCSLPICSNPCLNGGLCKKPDVCECYLFYAGDTCSINIIFILLPFGVCVILLIVFCFFFLKWFGHKQKLKKALSNIEWLVKWEDIEKLMPSQTTFSFTTNVSYSSSNFVRESCVTWRKNLYFLKRIPSESVDVYDENVRLQMSQMRRLSHPNIIIVAGACLEKPNVFFLLEIADKGSLEDILLNDTIQLGWDFRFSFMKDICRGMEYLHQSVFKSHGRLKSSNCLIDKRWTLKITDFGVEAIRYGPYRIYITNLEDYNFRELFWTAPELLRDSTTIDDVKSGTQEGDIYSFAIIVIEICTRDCPFVHECLFLSVGEILGLIKYKDDLDMLPALKTWRDNGGNYLKPMRPYLAKSFSTQLSHHQEEELKLMLASTWDDDPKVRVPFKKLLKWLNLIYPIQGDLIDNLIEMLEKYSSNLEQIVTERTRELQNEKAKTENLLSQMLPKQVVEDLKDGNQVEPESFECVTIFFSDIVGFTSIAKESTPFEVVDFLNELYSTFDGILDNYDVYKVETIGDAYMVVSGLPIRNGDWHAGEIATMALDLLSTITLFHIPHRPSEVVQLRIGIHSGPVVAGVVGLKMPRYTLFGDTVNTAARMESSSLAMRIHLSEATVKILQKLGGYKIKCRGEREVKGRGLMTTYWLISKEKFHKPLPDLTLATTPSHHEFK